MEESKMILKTEDEIEEFIRSKGVIKEGYECLEIVDLFDVIELMMEQQLEIIKALSTTK